MIAETLLIPRIRINVALVVAMKDSNPWEKLEYRIH
jgi:hypothetical protein